jgi:hypothetical protein
MVRVIGEGVNITLSKRVRYLGKGGEVTLRDQISTLVHL